MASREDVYRTIHNLAIQELLRGSSHGSLGLDPSLSTPGLIGTVRPTMVGEVRAPSDWRNLTSQILTIEDTANRITSDLISALRDIGGELPMTINEDKKDERLDLDSPKFDALGVLKELNESADRALSRATFAMNNAENYIRSRAKKPSP